MNAANLKRNAILKLAKVIVMGIPKKYFTKQADANKFMIAGDEKFSKNQGEFFTCGFGKEDLTPSDVESGKYFIAGYNSNNPAQSILDSMFARAVYIDDNTGRGGVVICSVDAVGMSRKDINDIRRLVIEGGKIPSLKSINICCTHTHSAIDTQGLWGEKITKSGRNEEFMQSLKTLTAKVIEAAYRNRRDGELFYSVTEAEHMQFDCRTPETYDKNLTKFRLLPFYYGVVVLFVYFASHAELLCRNIKSVSADFPCYMIKEIEKNGCNAIFLNGAIGGMISAKEIKKVYRNEIDCEEYTKSFGKQLGEIINAMGDEKRLSPLVNVKSAPLRISAENFVLILARLMNVLNNNIGRTEEKGIACVYSEVGYMELGDEEVGMFLIPGELFPELFNGDFLDKETSANGVNADYTALNNMGNAKHKFVVGLCNDELGYIIPENDFYLNEKMPYINNAHDKFQRKHYEETNSTGPKTAGTILSAMQELINSAK